MFSVPAPGVGPGPVFQPAAFLEFYPCSVLGVRPLPPPVQPARYHYDDKLDVAAFCFSRLHLRHCTLRLPTDSKHFFSVWGRQAEKKSWNHLFLFLTCQQHTFLLFCSPARHNQKSTLRDSSSQAKDEVKTMASPPAAR